MYNKTHCRFSLYLIRKTLKENLSGPKTLKNTGALFMGFELYKGIVL